MQCNALTAVSEYSSLAGRRFLNSTSGSGKDGEHMKTGSGTVKLIEESRRRLLRLLGQMKEINRITRREY